MSSRSTPPNGSPTIVDDHHHHRLRRELLARRTIISDMACRVVLILVRLVSIPFAIRMLGNERYGLWLTAGSVLMWLNLSQMGLSDGLLNELSKAFGRNDRGEMQRHVSTAYCCFGVIAIIAAVIIGILSATPVVITFLGVHNSPHLFGEARTIFLLTGWLLAATVLVNASLAVFGGMQETYLYYGFFAAGNLLVLLSLGSLSFTKLSLAGFTLGMALPPILVTAAGTIYLFGWRYPFLRPRVSLFDRKSLRMLMNFGGPLLIIQITEMIIFNSANPMIASRLGVGQVPLYAVPLSMFMLVSNFCNGIARAYLAGYIEACVRKDWHWIQSVTRRIRLQTGALMALAVIAIIVFGPWAIRVWAGRSVVPSTTMLVCMGIYTFLLTLTNTNFVVMLGIGKPRVRAACAIFIAIAHIAGFLILMPRLQLLALPVAGSIGYLGDILVSTIYASYFLRKRLKESACESRQLLEPVAPSISLQS